jgi:hypothetical protein
MTKKPLLQKIFHRILHSEDEHQQNHRRWEVSNHKKRKDKELESSID